MMRRVWLWNSFPVDVAGVSYLRGVNIELGTFMKAIVWWVARDSRSPVAVTQQCNASRSSEFWTKLQQVKKKNMQRHQKDLCLSVSMKSPKLRASSGPRDWGNDLISSLYSKPLCIFNSFLSEAAACTNCSHTNTGTLLYSANIYSSTDLFIMSWIMEVR